MSDGTYGLRFGSIDFSPGEQIGEVEYRIYGLKRGRPVPVTVVADSMMQDGTVEQVTGHTNRDQQIVIGMKSSDSQALATAETELWLEAQQQRNELAWKPPDGYGATTVYDVLWCDLSGVDESDVWDILELRQCERVYTLTVRALPFGRSESEVVTEALSSGASPSSTTIADGTSATNWTGTATVTAASGTLRQTVSTFDAGTNPDGAYYSSLAEWTYTPGSPLDFSSEAYLSLDVDPPGVPGSSAFFLTPPRLYADGVEQVLVAIDQPNPNVYRLTFAVSDASVAVLKLSTTVRTFTTLGSAPGSAMHQLDNVVKSNQAPGTSTTGREAVRRVEVKGSARTAASLAVEHDTTGLGDAPLVRVSIFMSVFDVHVNRTPIAGTIRQVVYISGKFLSADLDKASEENERQHILVEGHDGRRIGFTQIAGLVARRIVPFVKPGDIVAAGQRVGLIRFGSRVDVYLPEGVEPQVALGQRSIAGETVLGRTGAPAAMGVAQ